VAVLILFVCTANICRSPIAAALFARRAEHHIDPPVVASAGVTDAGRPVPVEVAEVMAARGIDLSGHRSTTLAAPQVAEAGLVVGMSLRHVQESVLLVPSSWTRTFRLKELVRRGEFIGSRLPGQDLATWIGAAQGDRRRDSLAHHSPVDDVADPYGGPLAGYEATVAELDDLTARLAALLWPRH
jgi:protein-tyrosine phosphatase